MGTSACGGSVDLPPMRLYVAARVYRCPCLRTRDSVDAPRLRSWCEYQCSVGGNKRLRALVLHLDEVTCETHVTGHNETRRSNPRHERVESQPTAKLRALRGVLREVDKSEFLS